MFGLKRPHLLLTLSAAFDEIGGLKLNIRVILVLLQYPILYLYLRTLISQHSKKGLVAQVHYYTEHCTLFLGIIICYIYTDMLLYNNYKYIIYICVCVYTYKRKTVFVLFNYMHI